LLRDDALVARGNEELHRRIGRRRRDVEQIRRRERLDDRGRRLRRAVELRGRVALPMGVLRRHLRVAELARRVVPELRRAASRLVGHLSIPEVLEPRRPGLPGLPAQRAADLHALTRGADPGVARATPDRGAAAPESGSSTTSAAGTLSLSEHWPPSV